MDSHFSHVWQQCPRSLQFSSLKITINISVGNLSIFDAILWKNSFAIYCVLVMVRVQNFSGLTLTIRFHGFATLQTFSHFRFGFFRFAKILWINKCFYLSYKQLELVTLIEILVMLIGKCLDRRNHNCFLIIALQCIKISNGHDWFFNFFLILLMQVQLLTKIRMRQFHIKIE